MPKQPKHEDIETAAVVKSIAGDDLFKIKPLGNSNSFSLLESPIEAILIKPDLLKDLSSETPIKSFEANLLPQVKDEINNLCSSVENITKVSGMYVVMYMYYIGSFLEAVENQFILNKKRKADYISWIKKSFQTDKLRYFQQCRQLFRMGSIPLELAPLGKNRILELDYLLDQLKEAKKSKPQSKSKLKSQSQSKLELYEDLMKKYPFPDQQHDKEGDLLRVHMDAIITYFRLLNAGIKKKEFEFYHCKMIAFIRKKAIEVSQANQLAKWIKSKSSEVRKQNNFVDIYVMNKLIPPKEDRRSNPKNVNTHLGSFVSYMRHFPFDDKSKLESIRKETVIKALQALQQLASQLGLDTK